MSVKAQRQTLLFLIAALVPLALGYGQRNLPQNSHNRNCAAQICSTEGPALYASYNGGGQCIFFSNYCNLEVDNCFRKENGDRRLIQVPKERCQEVCSRICPEVFSPVCARNGNTLRTFPNNCYYESEKCYSGNPWRVISESSCDNLQCNSDDHDD